MKRILGIILLIFGAIALLSLFIFGAVAQGTSFGTAILVVLISIAITLAIVGWIKLVLWLLF